MQLGVLQQQSYSIPLITWAAAWRLNRLMAAETDAAG